MATKLFCDWCNREINKAPADSNHNVVTLKLPNASTTSWDVCKDCNTKFGIWRWKRRDIPMDEKSV